ncbi:MAG: hypothetical protein AABX70_03030 [Nanoarchaeota archaeon]
MRAIIRLLVLAEIEGYQSEIVSADDEDVLNQALREVAKSPTRN